MLLLYFGQSGRFWPARAEARSLPMSLGDKMDPNAQTDRTPATQAWYEWLNFCGMQLSYAENPAEISEAINLISLSTQGTAVATTPAMFLVGMVAMLDAIGAGTPGHEQFHITPATCAALKNRLHAILEQNELLHLEETGRRHGEVSCQIIAALRNAKEPKDGC